MSFVLTELSIALTFLDVANVTQVGVTRTRNRANALTAYRMICRLLPRLAFSPDEQAAVCIELEQRLHAANEFPQAS